MRAFILALAVLAALYVVAFVVGLIVAAPNCSDLDGAGYCWGNP